MHRGTLPEALDPNGDLVALSRVVLPVLFLLVPLRSGDFAALPQIVTLQS